MVAFSLLAWLYLFFAHGRFWRSGPELPPAIPHEFPDVDVIIPARDEAELIGAVVASLAAQDYRGRFNIILVDDGSTDGTTQAAGSAPNLTILPAAPKPPGWSGKLWALSQGVAASRAPVVLLTDADVEHDPRHLSSLIARMKGSADSASGPRAVNLRSRLDVVSEMVRLNCTGWAERALIPAFVYFFQMLYPFARVNDPRSKVAAAAGGTVLIRREALERIGGIEAIRGALIDDVTLGRAVKQSGGSVYLGHSGLAASIRPYGLADIWHMIARTAFTQLRFSAGMLVLTIGGLTIVWLVPVCELVFGHGWRQIAGAVAFGLAVISYQPTLRRYRRSPLLALALPLIAAFYMAATVASAVRHWWGSGASWKRRNYP